MHQKSTIEKNHEVIYSLFCYGLKQGNKMGKYNILSRQIVLNSIVQ